MKYKKWTEEDFAELARLHAGGNTAKEIGILMGRSDESIKSYKVKLGLSSFKNKRTQYYMQDYTSKYLTRLKDIEVVDLNGVKGNSKFKCVLCNKTWTARLFDVVQREQGCVSCTDRSKSKIATKWLDQLGIQNREVNIPGTNYRVDGIVGNTVYEFLGDYWHGNLDIFEADMLNKRINKTFVELFEETVQRLSKIKSLGYTVVYIWENDYIQGKDPEILS